MGSLTEDIGGGVIVCCIEVIPFSIELDQIPHMHLGVAGNRAAGDTGFVTEDVHRKAVTLTDSATVDECGISVAVNERIVILAVGSEIVMEEENLVGI